MRIRAVFLACLCAAAIPGNVAAIWRAGTALDSLTRAGDAVQAMRAVAQVQHAQTAILFEVGAFAPTMALAQPDRARLERDGETTDRLIAAAAAGAASAGLDAAPPHRIGAAITALRGRLMQDIARPVAQRDHSIAAEAVALRNEAAAAFSELATAVSRRVAREAPELALLAEAASGVMDLRDYAGRRNAALTGWIGGGTLTGAGFEAAAGFSGRAAQAWAGVNRAIAAVPDNASLLPALGALRASYAERAEPRWLAAMALARQALESGAAPSWPETVAEWRGWATPAQADILLLRDAVLQDAVARAEAAAGRAWRSLVLSLGLVGLSLAALAGSMVLLLRRVVLPLQRLTGSVSAIAGGDLAAEVPGHGRADELGAMAGAVETLRQGSVERREMAAREQAAQAGQLARGQRIDALLARFEEETAGVLRVVASAATELDATAAGMAGIAADGTRHAGAVASAAGQASANVQTVAAAAEELSASISEVARQVRDGAGRAQAAVAAAVQAEQTVRGLADAAARIGDVVQMITSIAAQTNLLALNATIEAARAGEAGRGFAVVASEVKSLASQTAKATEEIGQQIAAMQAETNRTVQAIGAIAVIIDELNAATAHVAEAAGQQAEATREIGKAVAEAAQGTDAASRHAAGVSGDASRTGEAAGEVRAASGELAKRAEGLRAQMDGFLAAIRAA